MWSRIPAKGDGQCRQRSRRRCPPKFSRQHCTPAFVRGRITLLPVERTAKRWIVSSDPDEHVEKIKAYTDLGFRHLVFHAPGPDQARFLRLYGEQVLPRLRAALG